MVGAEGDKGLMKLKVNVLLSGLASLGQILNTYGGIIPPKYQTLVAGVLGGTTMIVAAVAHYRNPDGTPAVVPYVKEKE